MPGWAKAAVGASTAIVSGNRADKAERFGMGRSFVEGLVDKN
jgi:hypothetical protein